MVSKYKMQRDPQKLDWLICNLPSCQPNPSLQVSLDVSWCPRITDAALEYIACDLTHLEELTLDR